jgi:deazaflavin-dependent oxidoreductase (nitroreductase family)
MPKKPPPASSPIWKLLNLAGKANVVAYRASGGRLGGRMGKAPVLLLHHVGRRSGKERVAPLLYLDIGDGRLALVASKGGVDSDPEWFRNLLANPETTVEIGRERRRVRARQATEEEHAQLWPRLVEIYPSYATYQTFTTRKIPVVVLEPV